MNKLALCVLATVAATASVSAFAAQQRAVTRAEVVAELDALHAAGYRQTGEDPHYPVRLSEALTKIGSAHPSAIDRSGYGTMAQTGTESGSGSGSAKPEWSIYRGR
ncbi:MAG: DUF4148 domain-containing protein [Burkholderia sp.]|jgi:hypothetical protein|uniref:DUF4148 domain-containing protein n=1 Tax=Burkholderia sp. TaxID=36773 RepID=UPI00281BE8DE|nr:DUF4148 domain-containing protein [Burkholderia sp.]MDR0245516.1 DUF4148 domain-containing protein [Burkholderia sp.]